MPIRVGSQAFTTDDNGKFMAQVSAADDASVSSGLEAIKIESINDVVRETLPGTGAEVVNAAALNGGLLAIEISSRVSLAPLCLARSVDTGGDVIWFRYTNRYGGPLDVEEQRLNRVFSPSGVPYPISRFESTDASKPDGWYGYEWPLDYFRDVVPGTDREVIRAAWELIGKKVTIEAPASEVPRCIDSLQDRGCSRYTVAMVNRLFRVATRTVRTLSDAATKAEREGRWNPNGTFRKPVFDRAAESLRAIRQLLNQLPPEMFLCTGGAPQGCRQRTYPKTELLAHYDSIFKIRLPKALRHLTKLYPGERRKFLAELQRQPDQFVTCNR